MPNPHACSRVHKLRAEEIYEQIANASSRVGSTHLRDKLSHLPNLAASHQSTQFQSGRSASAD